MDLDTILRTAMEMGASDVHLVAGHVPMMRLHQIMTPLDFPVVTPESAVRMFKHMASAEQVARFEKIKDADFSYEIPGIGRFRVNAHLQRQTVGISMRGIKEKIPPMKDLNLPEVIARLTYLPRGLVLVTGDTGSGKSTTLAAMIQAMNDRYHKHIIIARGPDRIPLLQQQVHDRAARAGRRRAELCQRAAARAASGPGHHLRR